MMDKSKELHTNSATTNMQAAQNLNNNVAIEEVSALLRAWKLPQLCDIFYEQEVCTNALLLLTDNDINELITKIGPRAIFREELKKWKQQQQKEKEQQRNSVKNQTKAMVEHLFLSSDDINQQTNNNQILKEQETKNLSLNRFIEMEFKQEAPEDIDETSYCSETTANLENIEFLSNKDYEEEDEDEQNSEKCNENVNILNVLNILKNCVDGRMALKDFDTHGMLDAKNRRMCVKAVISAAVEINSYLKKAQFKNLAEQFVEIFPSEKMHDYYKPRNGTICPRGALYNRYINLTRHLRNVGKLKYQNKITIRRTR